MSIKNNLMMIGKSLEELDKSGIYDVEKLCCSLLHQTKELEYFYCHLVKDGNCDETYYQVKKRPTIHQLAYFNIGRGFPKELMDGHWCYILKDLGYKILIVPCTSIKKDSSKANPYYEYDIMIRDCDYFTSCRIQFSDIRSVDIQRIDLRKPFYDVVTPKEDILKFIYRNIFE